MFMPTAPLPFDPAPATHDLAALEAYAAQRADRAAANAGPCRCVAPAVCRKDAAGRSVCQCDRRCGGAVAK